MLRRPALTAILLLVAAAPSSASAATTVDADADGRIDALDLRCAGPRAADRAVVVGHRVRGARAHGRIVRLQLAEGRRPDTGARPHVRGLPCGPRRAVRARDGAGPVLLAAVRRPGGGVRATWSEPVRGVARWHVTTARGTRRVRGRIAVSRATTRLGYRAGLSDRRGNAARRGSVAITAARSGPPAPGPPAASAPATKVTPAPGPVPVTAPRPPAGPVVTDPSIAPVASRAAHSFAQSVGVNVHVSYTDTAYGDFDRMLARLKEVGITTVRDGLAVNNPEQFRRLRALAQNGVSLNLIMGDPRGRWGTGPLSTLVTVMKRELPGMVSWVEGANEYDLSGDPDWVDAARRHQRELYAAIKDDPATAHIPVLAPSVVWRSNRTRLGDLSAYSDRANMHPYPGGRPASTNLSAELDSARTVGGDEPVIATETGYHNAVASSGGHRGVPEATAGAYLPKLYLEYFRRGVQRTFAYEFVDQRAEPGGLDAESHFGLLRHDYSPKPAFGALKTLLGAVRDPGTPFTPGALRYALDGDTAGVRSLLLQRRDGTFVLALWHEESLFDLSTGTALAPGTRKVRVRLGDAITRARVVPVTTGATASVIAAPAAVDVAVGDAPVLVELQPGGAVAAASPSRSRVGGKRPPRGGAVRRARGCLRAGARRAAWHCARSRRSARRIVAPAR